MKYQEESPRSTAAMVSAAQLLGGLMQFNEEDVEVFSGRNDKNQPPAWVRSPLIREVSELAGST